MTDAGSPTVIYSARYEALAEYSNQSEKILTLGGLWLQLGTPMRIAAEMAVDAKHKALDAKDRALELGQHALAVLLPAESSAEPTPTEDS